MVGGPARTTLAAFAVASLATLAAVVALPVGSAVATSYPEHIVTAQPWTLNASPSFPENFDLYGTTCVNAGFCLAVGYTEPSTFDQPLVEQWNGSSWSVVTVPSPSATMDTTLFAVSCLSTSWCIAVGSAGPGTVTELWNGSSWTLGPVLSTSALDARFLGVSCVSSTDCWGVGKSNDDVSLIAQWNGTSWTSVPNPDPAGISGALQGVSCSGPSFCAAVGVGHNGSSVYSTLVKTWNGTAWTVDPSADPSGVDDEFSAVSCLSASFCMADGFADGGSGGTSLTLIEQWNGASWTQSASPSTPAQGDYLYGISCNTVDSCSAVGSAYTTPGNGGPYANEALVWNGSTWALVSAQNPGGSTENQFLAVSCVSGWACVSTGDGRNGTEFATLSTAPLARPGYTLGAADGGAFNFGAPFYGSQGGTILNAPIVGIAEMPDGGGYYEAASDGGVFTFGNAQFHGSLGNVHLNKPIVGIAVTPDGLGYWLVASDGGVFTFGDAVFYGSQGSTVLNKPVVGMAATPDGRGYWLVATDGGIFTHGDALFYGSQGATVLNKPIVGMATTLDGAGYWLVASDGGIFTHGDAAFHGSQGATVLNKPVVGMAATPDGAGYWLVASDGGIFTHGDAAFLGSMGNTKLVAPIVGMAN